MGFLQIFQNRDISVKGMQVTDVFKSDKGYENVSPWLPATFYVIFIKKIKN
jgi:hypothetical protein